MRKHWKILGAFLLGAYILAYSPFSLKGSCQVWACDVDRIWEYRWAPYGFFPTPYKPASYKNKILSVTFLPLWVLDQKFVHNNPPSPKN
jgi:hypothetical protein